ncbi:hypothetical protein [Larkinella knui]
MKAVRALFWLIHFGTVFRTNAPNQSVRRMDLTANLRCAATGRNGVYANRF